MTDRENTCSNCRCFDGDKNSGECRIGRPKLEGTPTIPSDYWCGEHEALPEAVKAEKRARRITCKQQPSWPCVGCSCGEHSKDDPFLALSSRPAPQT